MKSTKVYLLSLIFSIITHLVVIMLNFNSSSSHDLTYEKLSKASKKIDRRPVIRIRRVGKKESKVFNTISTKPKQNRLLNFFKNLTKSIVRNFRPNTHNSLQYIRSAEVVMPNIQNPIIKKSRFGLNIEPPKGVSFDQLNSMEKILHGFNVRVYKTFVNSFFSSLADIKSKFPSIESELLSDKQSLKGRMIFDKFGNIVSIKILKSSEIDHIHQLFEQTLLGINQIPNPPKLIINSLDQFVIYFRLLIN